MYLYVYSFTIYEYLSVSASLSACLSSHPPTHTHTHPPTYLPTYSPTHLPPTQPPTYLPTYLPIHPPTHLPTYLLQPSIHPCHQSHYLCVCSVRDYPTGGPQPSQPQEHGRPPVSLAVSVCHTHTRVSVSPTYIPASACCSHTV
jgi:hypothetical protein